MNKKEAKDFLIKFLDEYRAKSYSDLQYLLNTQDTLEVSADSGGKYQVEIQAVWDDKNGGNLRVIGAIDDGGLRAFVPLTDDFIISPAGEFIDE